MEKYTSWNIYNEFKLHHSCQRIAYIQKPKREHAKKPMSLNCCFSLENFKSCLEMIWHSFFIMVVLVLKVWEIKKKYQPYHFKFLYKLWNILSIHCNSIMRPCSGSMDTDRNRLIVKLLQETYEIPSVSNLDATSQKLITMRTLCKLHVL